MSRDAYSPTSATTQSAALWERARRVAPMGAQGDGKYYAPFPHFIDRAAGASIWDVDGNHYIDYWGGAGPCILGHADASVDAAVAKAAHETGAVFSAPHEREVVLSEKLAEVIPCAEMSAYLNAGSDVLYMAVRLARSITQRKRLVKFAGSYHGWYEELLFNVSSYDGPPDNHGLFKPIAESSGNTEEASRQIRVPDYNNLAALEYLFETEGAEIAAVVVEPVMHGPITGTVVPEPGFLERLRELCTEHGVILIFDEILTGFRHAMGGGQQTLGVTPDLACFGKAIANGYPISALCGRRELMEHLVPAGRAFFSGTYNGSPIGTAAALATIERLSEPGFFERLWTLGERLKIGLDEVFERRGVAARAVAYGSVVSIHNSDKPLRSYGDIRALHDTAQAPDFASFLYANGIYSKPRPVQRLLISGAHGEAEIDRTIEVVDAYHARQGA